MQVSSLGKLRARCWSGGASDDLRVCILLCKKEKNIRSTNFQSNRENNENFILNFKYYREHKVYFDNVYIFDDVETGLST